ncbi:MAG: type VII toxin-antitoxin system MntA family adenylyltransferase antitoxin [Desulfococcaceae bacterium]
MPAFPKADFAPQPPPNLERLKATLEAEPVVLFALIFGSFARGEERPDSDLDVAVYFSSPPEGLEVLEWLNRLSNAAEREVDLVVLNRASPLLRHQVMRHRIRLLVRDEAAYVRFRERTMRDYDEYLYVSGMGKFQ